MSGKPLSSLDDAPGLFCGLIATTEDGNETAGQGVIASLARAGAQVHTATPVDVGDKIRLFLPAETELLGTVVSCEGETVAVSFADTLSASSLRTMEASLSAGGQPRKPDNPFTASALEQNSDGSIRNRHLLYIVPIAIAVRLGFWGVDLARTFREKLTGTKR